MLCPIASKRVILHRTEVPGKDKDCKFKFQGALKVRVKNGLAKFKVSVFLRSLNSVGFVFIEYFLNLDVSHPCALRSSTR